mmetsp:Transcript_12975/g.18125  ORF Transcript_12975/g.18125 Transcript_12975/m.18125 type:complete len:103 (+) Transcript_12975:157-465(+)
MNPLWHHWSYVAHQRLVMAQLAERYPPRESSLTGLTGQMHDEVKFRCDPWRNYESAAEAQLKLGVCLERENKLKQSTKQSTNIRFRERRAATARTRTICWWY